MVVSGRTSPIFAVLSRLDAAVVLLIAVPPTRPYHGVPAVRRGVIMLLAVRPGVVIVIAVPGGPVPSPPTPIPPAVVPPNRLDIRLIRVLSAVLSMAVRYKELVYEIRS